jgi:multidrug efflux system membrane fusion protein
VRGQLTFLSNMVNTSSGTIELRATFANENLWLWPGQFANVVLTLTSQPNAVVVPSQAVQTGPEGQYVYIVKPDLTAEYRPVTIGQTVGNETVIKEGVRPGENVVTDGQLRLSNGAHVRLAPPAAGQTPEAGP